MPKNKTHSGTSKRVRVTGSGKLLTQSANRVHKFQEKSSRRERRLNGTFEVSKADAPRIKKLLGL